MPPHADVLQWEHLPFPKSLPQFQRLFPDDAACARWLESAPWARQAWQQEQERNLCYVAATRAKRKLVDLEGPPKLTKR